MHTPPRGTLLSACFPWLCSDPARKTHSLPQGTGSTGWFYCPRVTLPRLSSSGAPEKPRAGTWGCRAWAHFCSRCGCYGHRAGATRMSQASLVLTRTFHASACLILHHYCLPPPATPTGVQSQGVLTPHSAPCVAVRAAHAPAPAFGTQVGARSLPQEHSVWGGPHAAQLGSLTWTSRGHRGVCSCGSPGGLHGGSGRSHNRINRMSRT